MFANALKVFVVLAGLLSAFADTASWQTTSVTKVTTLIGVYATQKDSAYAAVLDNSLGAGLLYTGDYGASSEFYGPVGAMNMDVAFTADGQTGCVVGFGGIFTGPPNSANYTRVPNLHTITQNVDSFSTGGFGATGQFSLGRTSVNGVAVTVDSGNSWNIYDIGLGEGYSARYGSFPTESTWYVASGMWPAAKLAASKDTKHITKTLSINEKNVPQFTSKGSLRSGDDLGYYGGISKTTDGGKTWSKVYDSQGEYYFNQINCFDENNCIAVGENDSGYIVGTQDGGATWKDLYFAEGVSLVAVEMISATEAWAAGGGENAKRQMVGNYYHTTDAGATWELLGGSGYVFDLSFKDGVGYSAAISSNYATMCVYK